MDLVVWHPPISPTECIFGGDTARTALLGTTQRRGAEEWLFRLRRTRPLAALTQATIERSHIDIELPHAPPKLVHVRQELG